MEAVCGQNEEERKTKCQYNPCVYTTHTQDGASIEINDPPQFCGGVVTLWYLVVVLQQAVEGFRQQLLNPDVLLQVDPVMYQPLPLEEALDMVQVHRVTRHHVQPREHGVTWRNCLIPAKGHAAWQTTKQWLNILKSLCFLPHLPSVEGKLYSKGNPILMHQRMKCFGEDRWALRSMNQ